MKLLFSPSFVRVPFLLAIMLAIPAFVVADGVTDFVIDPAATRVISAPGSYRLSANATMTADVPAIDVSSDDVTLDLNGHTITGVAGGTTHGITSTGDDLHIFNGRIRRFGLNGIQITGDDPVLTDLKVVGCLGSGIQADGIGAKITGCVARNNDKYGFLIGEGALMENCSAQNNNRAGEFGGIQTGPRAVLRGCSALSNTPVDVLFGAAIGIDVGDHSVVVNCVASGNSALLAHDALGFRLGTNSVITGCTSSGNIGASNGFACYGIITDSGCQIFDNTCSGNHASGGGTVYGILAGAACRVENNTVFGNSATGGDTSAQGIAGVGCVIRGDMVSANNSAGTGTAAGIAVFSQGNLIEDNHCTEHVGFFGFGIHVGGADNVIRSNTTAANSIAGIRLEFGGSRVERNRMSDSGGLSNAGGNSLGTGEDANITY